MKNHFLEKLIIATVVKSYYNNNKICMKIKTKSKKVRMKMKIKVKKKNKNQRNKVKIKIKIIQFKNNN